MKRWSVVKGVMFQDFLIDFDRHKCGEIPMSQFRSGISMSSYVLTEKEFRAICQSYASESRPGWIKWRHFADDIMSAIAPKDLEKTPQENPEHPRSLVIKSRGTAAADMPPQVTRILEIVARFVEARRVSLPEQFKDKDRMNHRRISGTSFAQVLQLIGVHVSKGEIDVLCGYYNDPQTDFVDYPRFIEDVDRMVGSLFGSVYAGTSIVVNEIPKYGNEDSPYLVSRSAVGQPKEWPEILQRLQTFVFKRRIRLDDFFLAFDFHHNGQVSRQKFHSVVGQANLPLTAEQIEICIQTFLLSEADGLVNYRDFCGEINEIFGVRHLNRTPLNQSIPISHAEPDPSSTLQRLCERDEEQLRGVLKKMKDMVTNRRMNIREQFMDYDTQPRKCYITKQQFKQSIARLGLTTSPGEFDLLCRKYRCTDLEEQNYLAFCNDVDPQ
jgi:Ca2+-binding EF-hand superfamily protein